MDKDGNIFDVKNNVHSINSDVYTLFLAQIYSLWKYKVMLREKVWQQM